MKTTRRARREARRLYRACLVDGLLDGGRVLFVVERVAGAGHHWALAILSHFQRLVKLDLDRRTARVESAVALSPAQQSELVNSLTRRYGHGLNISFTQNPTLLGGLRIQVGSDVYDGTVQARLNALADSF